MHYIYLFINTKPYTKYRKEKKVMQLVQQYRQNQAQHIVRLHCMLSELQSSHCDLVHPTFNVPVRLLMYSRVSAAIQLM